MDTPSCFAFIGSYAEPDGPGLYTCGYDAASGKLELLTKTAGLKNPTFLDIDADHSRLYAIAEGINAGGERVGLAAAYAIDRHTGQLALLNEEITVPAPTCHILLDKESSSILVSSYHGGMVGVSPVLADGRIGQPADERRPEGRSLLPIQDRPRAHSVFQDRARRYLGVCDLGLDRIFIYRLDAATHRLIPHGDVRLAPGSGPRHFAFHPSRPFGYVINELNATVTAFAYDEERGELSEIQTIPTLPDSYQGDNACADIHISPDGRYLYGSNRGHDSIVVYRIDSDSGRLAWVENVSTLGGHPRNFAISPDGQFLLVANRDSDNIVTFRRDSETGKLTAAGIELSVSKPVCIRFAKV